MTKETNVSVKINLDGTGVADATTGIPFLDHMLDVRNFNVFFFPNLLFSLYFQLFASILIFGIAIDFAVSIAAC